MLTCDFVRARIPRIDFRRENPQKTIDRLTRKVFLEFLMSFTLQEIESQPKAWKSTLRVFDGMKGEVQKLFHSVKFDRIVVCGCGSTYYFAHSTAQHLSLHTTHQIFAFPSSEVWLLPGIFPVEGTMVLAVSRSGTTTETLRAVERFRNDGGGTVVTITCHPESPLASMADLVLAAPDAQERSVVQTRSFTSMYLLMMAITYTLGGQEDLLAQLNLLPGALEALVSEHHALPSEWGIDLGYQKVFFLGTGPLYGLACEAMLKLKEMSLTWTETYHTLEIRHGPMSLVDDQTLVIGLISDSATQTELDVLRDMGNLGADVAMFSGDGVVPGSWEPTWHITVPDSLDEWVRGPLYLAFLHRLGYHRAVAKGLDPDLPTNLSQVIKL
jgi:glucosamine--fructose-6-phosphate aminotransferase (isomerizing)